MATEKIKKAVTENVRNMLNAELTRVNYKIYDNKNAMKRLVEEQTILKRERVRLTELLNSIK